MEKKEVILIVDKPKYSGEFLAEYRIVDIKDMNLAEYQTKILNNGKFDFEPLVDTLYVLKKLNIEHDDIMSNVLAVQTALQILEALSGYELMDEAIGVFRTSRMMSHTYFNEMFYAFLRSCSDALKEFDIDLSKSEFADELTSNLERTNTFLDLPFKVIFDIFREHIDFDLKIMLKDAFEEQVDEKEVA